MIKKILVLLTVFITSFSFAQYQIYLYDGSVIYSNATKISDGQLYFATPKGKEKVISTEEVFAVLSNQDTVFLVDSAAAKNSELKNEEILSYIRGLHDGFKNNDQATLAASATIGFMSGLFMPTFGISSLMVPVPNTIFVFSTGFSKTENIKKTGDKLYDAGYATGTKRKKVLNAIEGSVAGLIIGTLASYLILQ